MSFEDYMMDDGFSNEQEYMNYLESEALDSLDWGYDNCDYEYEDYLEDESYDEDKEKAYHDRLLHGIEATLLGSYKEEVLELSRVLSSYISILQSNIESISQSIDGNDWESCKSQLSLFIRDWNKFKAEQIITYALGEESPVVVKKNPETGSLYTESAENSDIGYVALESHKIITHNGSNEVQNRLAYAKMEISLINTLIELRLIDENKIFPAQGKIVIRNSLEEYYSGQLPRVNQLTGEDILYGKTLPIYRQYVYDLREGAKDQIIEGE